MFEWVGDRLPHFRHAAHHGKRPRRREHIELESRVSLMQERHEGLREYGIADPGRADDQNSHDREQALGSEKRNDKGRNRGSS